jgi:CheY-like chemotaxis protein
VSTWVTVLLACALAFGLKLAGYLVPRRWVEGERRSRVTTLLPVALLAALVGVQTFVGDGGSLVLDARAAALAAGADAFLRKPLDPVVLVSTVNDVLRSHDFVEADAGAGP